jgi:hypothetical protein
LCHHPRCISRRILSQPTPTPSRPIRENGLGGSPLSSAGAHLAGAALVTLPPLIFWLRIYAVPSAAIARLLGISWWEAAELLTSFVTLADACALVYVASLSPAGLAESLGLRRLGVADIAGALLVIAATVRSDWLIHSTDLLTVFGVTAAPSGTAGTANTSTTSSAIWLTVLAIDSFWEELATRAYVIEALRSWKSSLGLGAIVSVGASIAVHAPEWGLFPALLKAPGFGLLVALYCWRRNFLTNFLCHLGFNLLVFGAARNWTIIAPLFHRIAGG